MTPLTANFKLHNLTRNKKMPNPDFLDRQPLIENPRIIELLGHAGIKPENLNDPEWKKIISKALEKTRQIIVENYPLLTSEQKLEDMILEITRAVLIALCDADERNKKIS